MKRFRSMTTRKKTQSKSLSATGINRVLQMQEQLEESEQKPVKQKNAKSDPELRLEQLENSLDKLHKTQFVNIVWGLAGHLQINTSESIFKIMKLNS